MSWPCSRNIAFHAGLSTMLQTLDALQAHDVAPHMQEYRAKVKQHIRGREIRVLSPA